MEHIKPIIENLSACLLEYKHRNIQEVMNDTDIENQNEKYTKAGVVGCSNLLINCLIFNIECVTVFCKWAFKEYTNIKTYYTEYNYVTNVNEDYVDISNNVVDKKND
jgi:hypothetical protein